METIVFTRNLLVGPKTCPEFGKPQLWRRGPVAKLEVCASGFMIQTDRNAISQVSGLCSVGRDC